jgi:hypothetical protein
VLRSTLSFDIAQLELVLPLTCGAKIVMVSSAIQRYTDLLSPWPPHHRA